jgi:hypothetical protein
MTTILHNDIPHHYVRPHTRGGIPIKGHWRPAPIGAGDTYSGDPDVMSGADNAGASAPPTNPNERDTLPGGKAS